MRSSSSAIDLFPFVRFTVLLVLNPRAADFNAFALLPIVSAILYALAMILTRSRCRTENVLVLSIALNTSMLLVGVLATTLVVLWTPEAALVEDQQFLLGVWSTMGGREWMAVILLSAAIIIGSVGAAFAYQNGPSSVIATFDFAYVAFAAGWGFVLFSEAPGARTVTGMVLIVGAGILAVRQSEVGSAVQQGARG